MLLAWFAAMHRHTPRTWARTCRLLFVLCLLACVHFDFVLCCLHDLLQCIGTHLKHEHALAVCCLSSICLPVLSSWHFRSSSRRMHLCLLLRAHPMLSSNVFYKPLTYWWWYFWLILRAHPTLSSMHLSIEIVATTGWSEPCLHIWLCFDRGTQSWCRRMCSRAKFWADIDTAIAKDFFCVIIGDWSCKKIQMDQAYLVGTAFHQRWATPNFILGVISASEQQCYFLLHACCIRRGFEASTRHDNIVLQHYRAYDRFHCQDLHLKGFEPPNYLAFRSSISTTEETMPQVESPYRRYGFIMSKN